MTLHTLLTATSAVVHPHSLVGATPLATTTAVAAAVLVVGVRQRRHRTRHALVAASTRGAVRPEAAPRTIGASPHRDRRSPALTCRPQLLTPAGTARAREQVELWRLHGELDPETYLDLQRVIAEVEAARD